MPKTTQGIQLILGLSDHFSRWADALPIPDATVPTLAKILDERVFAYMGLPEQLHSDQGAQFTSNPMVELCLLWRVNKTLTTLYHPQSNGVVERNNRTLGDALRTGCLAVHKKIGTNYCHTSCTVIGVNLILVLRRRLTS